MKHGHFARLLSSIEEARAPATSSEASYPSTSMSPNPETDLPSDLAQLGPIEVGPRVIVAPRDGVAQLGVAQIGSNEIELNEVDGPLLKVYDTWTKARVASYNHSTQLSCSAMMDNKSSGGRYKIVRCRTVLSKKKASGEGGGPKCAYKLKWSRDKKGDWKLILDQSILRHMPLCSSGQRVTQIELLHDDNFIRNQRLGKLSTGKAAAESALSSHGRMAGSVKDFTARRARNTINHFNDVDYDDDWSKLNEWGQKFMELNPHCLFDLEMDEENR